MGVPLDELPRPVAILASFFSDRQWSANKRMHSLAGTLTAVEGMGLLTGFRTFGSADLASREVVIYVIAMLALLKFATDNFVRGIAIYSPQLQCPQAPTRPCRCTSRCTPSARRKRWLPNRVSFLRSGGR